MAEEIDLSQYQQASKFWIPDTKNLWLAATVFTPPSNKGLTVKTDDGQFFVIRSLGPKGIEIATEDNERVEKHKIFSLPAKNPDFLEGCPDLTTLSYLHEPAVLHNLKVRYLKDEIYTFTGAILIALNPWKAVPALYTEDVMRKYSEAEEDQPPPHVYYVANTAYKALRDTNECQTILVSGESGAGKTENCKILMRYLAMTTGSYQNVGEIEQRVLQSNPILEAFGNARTLRNDNSSRFGKFTEIQFNSAGRIVGAKIETYLLEKSRLTRLGPGDRNFHILYQLIAGADEAERDAFRLGLAESYHYLNQSDVYKIEGRSEVEEFKATKMAMNVMGISDREQEATLRVVAAILHLGNIQFTADNKDAATSNSESLSVSAELLKVETANLQSALTQRKIFAGGEYLSQALRVEQASDARDALAKALYSRLFQWLVMRINSSIHKDSDTERFIGVLDIFGFEYFEENSFEQLCINYANEKIQQLFNMHIFKMEQKEYAKEQIKWTYVDFKDNQIVLDLIEDKPNGVLSILDEECMLPKGTDEGFVTKVLSRCNGEVMLKNRFSTQGFIIKHFAGEVSYDSYQFLNKNRDALHPDLVPCIQQSKDVFIKALFPSSMFHREAMNQKKKGVSGARGHRGNRDSTAELGAESGSKIFQVTVGTQFKDALKDLSTKIWQTTPYFVRCIKPNSIKKPRVFDNHEVALQLNCGGVFEAIRIMRDMYPSRLPHETFYKRFTTHEWKCIIRVGKFANLFRPLEKNNFDDFESLRLSCLGLCQALALGEDNFQVGRSKVFFRTGILAQQEDRLQRYIFKCASKIRAKYLGWKHRKKFVKQRKASFVIQRCIRRFIAIRKVKRLRRDRAARLIQMAWRKTRRVSGFRKVVFAVTRQHYLKQRMIEIEKKREDSARKIQTAFRRHLHRKRFLKFRQAVTLLQARQRGAKVRATNKINKAVNIVEEKKRLEGEYVRLTDLVAQLQKSLNDSNAANVVLDEKNTNLAGELATTTEHLNATKAAKKKLEEKAQTLSVDLAETRAKLDEETAAKEKLSQSFDEITQQHTRLTADHKDLLETKTRMDLELRTLREQFRADKERLEGELAYLRREIEEEQQEKETVASKLVLQKGTVGAMETIIRTLRNGLRKVSRQVKHTQESAKLEVASIKSNLERETFLQLSALKKTVTDSWKAQDRLREEKADLENDLEELEERLAAVVQDLMGTEKELADETEAHWRTNDQKTALEKQVATGAALFSALDAKRERLEKELDEKTKEIASLKANLNRAQQQQQQAKLGALPSLTGSVRFSSESGLISRRRRAALPSMVNKINAAPDAAQESERITKAGWLTKDRRKGDTDKRQSKWERRWFVLRSTSATYYDEQDAKKPKGEIPLDACFVSEDTAPTTKASGVSTTEPCFKLVTGGRTLYFMADTAEETRAWVSALKTNIAFNAYLKKAVMTKTRIDPRVGNFIEIYQSTESGMFESEPFALEAMVAIQASIKDSFKLTSLSFEDASLGDLQVQVLAEALASHKTLKSLNLSKNSITDVGVKSLAASLTKVETLDTLILSENKFKTEGAEALAKLLKTLLNLSRLFVDSNDIGDAGVSAIAGALSRDNRASSLVPKPAENKRSSSNNPNAVHRFPILNFTSTKMGDKACDAIAAMLKTNATIVDLFLSHNGIEDRGATVLAKALEKNESVQTLDLSANQINIAGAVALSKMLEVNPKVLSMSIGGNRFTSGKEISNVIATVAADSKLVFPLLAFERQAAFGL